jgi:hypothetical protein
MDERLCRDHDEDCPSIFAEGKALRCWLYNPSRGFCPYLRSTKQPDDVEERVADSAEAGTK